MSDTNDEILHVIGRGVASLRHDLAEATQRGEISEADFQSMRSRHLRAEEQLAEARTERATRTLDSYDRITLDLFHFIVELSGHRDTAKTKAERMALGHVVERLKEIRDIDDYGLPSVIS